MMTSDRRLLYLSNLIQENTARVDSYIEKNGLPEPSFEASYPPVFYLPPEADASRKAALEALDELRDHLLGPLEMIRANATDLADKTSMQGLIHFKLAEHLPNDGNTITIAELSNASNVHPDTTETIIRHAVTRRLVIQREDGKFTHSAASKALATFPNLSAFLQATLENMWRAAPFTVDAMEKWPGSQDINQTAFSLARNTNKSFFEYLATNELKAKTFAEAMTFMESGPALRAEFVLKYDWSQHKNGTIVDVGGSQGVIAFKLAEKFPEMRLIVQDRPEVVAVAPQIAHKNVSFQEHDFFSAQPVKGADVYFFRWILHDWPDKYCSKILQALKPALKPGARVVLMDAIVPEPGALSPFQERPLRAFSMVMKTLFNARERSETDWRNLIEDTFGDGQYKIVEVLRPAGSQLGFVVIEWKG